MANESSTKPTYSDNWMVEEKDPLLWNLRYIGDSPTQEHGGFHPNDAQQDRVYIEERYYEDGRYSRKIGNGAWEFIHNPHHVSLFTKVALAESSLSSPPPVKPEFCPACGGTREFSDDLCMSKFHDAFRPGA